MAVWIVRAGRHYEQEEDALNNNVVAIGWHELPDLSKTKTIDELKSLYLQIYPGTSKASLSMQWSQIWSFIFKIKVGDRVLLPLKHNDMVAIGRVVGDYQYRDDISPETYHVRAVEWIDKGALRSQFDEAIKRALLIPKTVIEVSSNGIIPETPENKKAWIFQANPEKYNLRGAISSLEELTWRVTSYKKDIHIGDHVYLWESGLLGGVMAVALVTSEPAELPKNEAEIPFIIDREKLDVTKPGVWLRIDRVLQKPLLKSEIKLNHILSGMLIFRIAQGTNFPVTPEEDKELQKMIGIASWQPGPVDGPESVNLAEWKRLLLRKKQMIFYGPPGTGKTFMARRMARSMTSGTGGFYELVQFHPSYAYEDFIQGIRPQITPAGLTYEMIDGRFLEFCQKAEHTPDSPCVLIVDEINRANLARVFGELMYLLEYRDQDIPLAGGKRFRIPENVYIIGTMNTADRSIALVDHAMRRRFAFVRLAPDYETLDRFLALHKMTARPLIDVLHEVNLAIDNANYELGISYFMKDRLKDCLHDIWVWEIEPYLEEYFYDRPEKVRAFRWSVVSEKLKISLAG